MILKLKRTPGLYLVGFMGCGKTTVGRLVAEELGWRFADLDDDIETDQRASISHLFATRGEVAFRDLEHDALLKRVRRVQSGHPLVLALGGGAFMRPDNIAAVNENGISIWLDATFDIVKKRVGSGHHRPLARDPDRFARLFEERRGFYQQAEVRIEVARDDSRAVAAEILDLPFLRSHR